MFVLFDARCRKCQKSFKAEADSGSEQPSDRSQYRCACPKCFAAVTVRGEHGTVSETATGWAVRATVISGMSTVGPDSTS